MSFPKEVGSFRVPLSGGLHAWTPNGGDGYVAFALVAPLARPPLHGGRLHHTCCDPRRRCRPGRLVDRSGRPRRLHPPRRRRPHGPAARGGSTRRPRPPRPHGPADRPGQRPAAATADELRDLAPPAPPAPAVAAG